MSNTSPEGIACPASLRVSQIHLPNRQGNACFGVRSVTAPVSLYRIAQVNLVRGGLGKDRRGTIFGLCFHSRVASKWSILPE